VEDVEQAGQLSIYNSRPGGGEIGHPVELGDYDGDGRVDFVLAPLKADSGPDGERLQAGEVYVYAGTGSISGILDRSDPDAELPGLTLLGARRFDNTGTELFTADVNGDGVDDLLLSAQNYGHVLGEGPDDRRINCGVVYVILGRPGLYESENGRGRTIDLLEPNPDVIKIAGATPGERFGIWVEAGDLDGDGIDDLLVGADQWPHLTSLEDPRRHVGKAYVIYGRREYAPEIDLATFDEGVSIIKGRDHDDHFGACIHSRDLDGNGYDELVVSASLARLSGDEEGESPFVVHSLGSADGPDNLRHSAGEVYVLHHDAELSRLPAEVDLSKPLPDSIASRLTTIYGAENQARTGEEISSVDLDGDGRAELVLGSLTASNTDGVVAAGAAHVIYWNDELGGTTIDLASPSPDGPHISAIYGRYGGDILGDTIAAGDFDNDGFEDLAIGIPHWDDEPTVVPPREGPEPGSGVDRGMVAIVFGRPGKLPAEVVPQDPDSHPGLEIRFVVGAETDDLLSYSMEVRDVDGDGFADLLSNAMRGDGRDETSENAGEAYVISGFSLTESHLSIDSVEPNVVAARAPFSLEISGRGFTTSEDTRVALGGVEAIDVQVRVQSSLIAEFVPLDELGSYDLELRTRHGEVTCSDCVTVVETVPFTRSDVNRSVGSDISDAVEILRYLFLGGGIDCLDAAYVDDNGQIQITDSLYLLEFLFRGGVAPPAPFPDKGTDPTEDDLGCAGR